MNMMSNRQLHGRPLFKKDGFLLTSAMAFCATLRPVGVVGRTGTPDGWNFGLVVVVVGELPMLLVGDSG
ncbi:uncharacterized protein PG986_002089 [Apiospora aurea]|uniref:Uncharacterized protein n=1 Tax=Apiospora aurea TaxID=335848 RepID=A0ABR1QYP2_9PEZI